MKENLNSLFAAGGGDGPEAATAALKAACDLVRLPTHVGLAPGRGQNGDSRHGCPAAWHWRVR